VPYDPIPVSIQWKEDWIAEWCQKVVEWLGVPEGRAEAAFRESVSMPEFFPPVSDFRTGTDGRLWIREAKPDTMEVQWLVMDSLGHELGRLHAPDGFRLLLPAGSDVYGVQKNELDVETVVRAGIVEAGH
jgi:hypothetical protein